MAKILVLSFSALLSASSFAQWNYYSSSTLISPSSVSNTGVTVAATGTAYSTWNPFAGTTTSIGGAPTGGVTVGISANGQFVGGTAQNPSNSRNEMSRYNSATSSWQNFGGGGGFTGTLTSTGWGISGDGSVVVGTGYGAPQSTGTFTGIRALSSNGTTVTNHSPILTANGVNRIVASNSDGSVVAGQTRWLNGATQTDGQYYWSSGTQVPMYVSGTSFVGSVNTVSYDGSTVGGSGNTNTVTTISTTFNNNSVGNLDVRRPYLFNTLTNTATLLGTDVVGANGNLVAFSATTAPRVDGQVTGVSADGKTAVGFFRQNSPSVFIDKTWGFIWTSTGGMQSIDTWAASKGIVNNSTWFMPLGISPDGNSIVGSQIVRGGTTSTGFMITSVPEPATMAVLIGGIGFLARRRRNQK